MMDDNPHKGNLTATPFVMRRPRRTNARWHALAADLARRLSDSKRRYAALVNESQRQSDVLARLDYVRSVIGRENTVDMILRVAIEAIAGIFGYPSVSIYMLEDDVLVIKHGIGHIPPATQILSHSFPLGHVVHTGEPLVITDTCTFPERLDLGPGVASIISVPLRVGGRVAGVVHIESSQPDVLSTDDLLALITLSDHIGKAVERTLLRGDFQRTMRETMALNQMMSVITTAKDTREALEAICADLTVPVYNVLGMTRELGDTPLSAGQRAYVEEISTSGQAMLSIITTILDLAKIDLDGTGSP